MNRKLLLLFCLTLIVPISIWGWDRYQDSQIKVHVDSVTPLYTKEVDAVYGSQTTVKMLKPGERLRVKRTTYRKDYGALLVETDEGIRGWIAFGQQGLTIDRRK